MIYVVHPLPEQYDYSAAKVYGDFEYINHKYVYPDELRGRLENELPPHFMDKIIKAAERFRPRQDYVMLMGDDIQLAAFIFELSALYEGFRVLRFDRKAGGYIVVNIGHVQ